MDIRGGSGSDRETDKRGERGRESGKEREKGRKREGERVKGLES